MGYQMPNVVQEIYLSSDLSAEWVTFTEYKNKFGIDLDEILGIDGGAFLCKKLAKYYLISLSYGSGLPKVGAPNQFNWSDGDNEYPALIFNDKDVNYAYGLVFNFEEKEVRGFTL